MSDMSNETPIYKQRGGGWVHDSSGKILLQLTWPFVTINLYEDRVLLNYGGKKVSLPYNKIEKIERSCWIPFIAEGIKIVHNDDTQSSLVRFWSSNSKKLKRLIEERMVAHGQ